MYGSRLEQNYGWYKRQDMFKRGIYQSPVSGASRYITDNGDIAFFAPSSPPDFLPCISDDVPSRLGIWDKWENESTLHKIVTSIFPEFTIARFGGWETDSVMKGVYRHAMQDKNREAQREASRRLGDSLFH